MENTKQLCTFRLANLHLGLDVLAIQEVIKCPTLAPVPLAPECIEGLLNLRGQILTAIDLRSQLGLPRESRSNSGKMLIIVRTRSVEAALLVDSVGDVLDVTDESFEETTANVSPSVRPFLEGVHKLENSLLHVLNAEAAASLAPTSI